MKFSMAVVKTRKALRNQLNVIDNSSTLGLVPTMGALHLGHISLIRKALSENQYVVVSIFVNPTQFNNTEDLEKYPKQLENDTRLISSVSEDIIIFAPTISEIYQERIVSKIYDFDGLDKVMEGAFRENHFNGVGTIVEKLLRLTKPTKAYFGEKDFQQLRIIQKLIEIEDIPVEIIGCEIVREDHGLAMSSRNERLSENIRQKARFIYDTLRAAKDKFDTESIKIIKDWVAMQFEENDDLVLEYFEITDVETLTPAKKKIANTKYRAFIAVYAEKVRLIDNLALN